jgi:SAM-dependent methyltransferase
MMNPAEFSNIAEAERTLWWYRGMKRILDAFAGHYVSKRQCRRVLEAGCGTGFYSFEMTERGLPMYPLDLGWEGLRYARQMGLKSLVQADIAELPYADASFDIAFSLDVLVHFPEGAEDRPLRELSRVLSQGGLLVLRVSALDCLRSRHSQFAHERQRFTRRRLIRQTANAGFRMLRCTYANSFLLPVALAKFRIWEPLTRQPPASGVAPLAPWIDSLLFVPLWIESTLIAAGLRFPIGQSLLYVGEKAG